MVMGMSRMTQNDRVMTRKTVSSMAPMRPKIYLNIRFTRQVSFFPEKCQSPPRPLLRGRGRQAKAERLFSDVRVHQAIAEARDVIVHRQLQPVRDQLIAHFLHHGDVNDLIQIDVFKLGGLFQQPGIVRFDFVGVTDSVLRLEFLVEEVVGMAAVGGQVVVEAGVGYVRLAPRAQSLGERSQTSVPCL